MPSKRITLVADELLGLQGGGIGTATSHLALGLARIGHEVSVLYIASPADVSPEWKRRYDSAGIRVRMLERRHAPTEPSFFGRMCDVSHALEADEPDVVVAQDLAAPGYVALRLRQLGLALEQTLFVVFCHGTRRWITDVSGKARVLPGAHAISVLEQASIELSDAVVSPSAYMLEWMRRQKWRLPEQAHVLPLLTAGDATGDPPARAAPAGESIERIAFFGRLEPRKGANTFVAALNTLEPALLSGVELAFVGRAASITPSEIEASLDEATTSALGALTFQCELDHDEALAFLDRRGTIVVVPSFEDNSPNTVYECLERAIPFLASNTGGIPELIAPEDHRRVLFEPSPRGIAEALTRTLRAPGAPRPARPGYDHEEVLKRWAEILERSPRRSPRTAEQPAVDVVVVENGSRGGRSRCLAALDSQRYGNFSVTLVKRESTVEAARLAGLESGAAPWVVFLDEDDEPDPSFLDTLVCAQRASRADVVTCAVSTRGEDGRGVQQFFLGQPGGLGVLSNAYGMPALVRRAALTLGADLWPAEGDADWPLLARLSASGARIVSVPLSLATCARSPGALNRDPRDALLVVEHLERALPAGSRSMARLAAGLGGSAPGSSGMEQNGTRLLRGVLRNGQAGFARRLLPLLRGARR